MMAKRRNETPRGRAAQGFNRHRTTQEGGASSLIQLLALSFTPATSQLTTDKNRSIYKQQSPSPIFHRSRHWSFLFPLCPLSPFTDFHANKKKDRLQKELPQLTASAPASVSSHIWLFDIHIAPGTARYQSHIRSLGTNDKGISSVLYSARARHAAHAEQPQRLPTRVSYERWRERAWYSTVYRLVGGVLKIMTKFVRTPPHFTPKSGIFASQNPSIVDC